MTAKEGETAYQERGGNAKQTQKKRAKKAKQNPEPRNYEGGGATANPKNARESHATGQSQRAGEKGEQERWKPHRNRRTEALKGVAETRQQRETQAATAGDHPPRGERRNHSIENQQRDHRRPNEEAEAEGRRRESQPGSQRRSREKGEMTGKRGTGQGTEGAEEPTGQN